MNPKLLLGLALVLSGGLCSLSAAGLHAADMVAPSLSDDWSVKSDFKTLHSIQFVSRLTHDQLVKTPAWQSDSEYPPLSPRKAEKLALAMLHTIMGERDWSQPNISLKAFDVGQDSSGQRDVRWFYVLQFGLVSPAAYEGGSFNIIVLMDGTVIEPKRVDNKP
jgi:hypothetical protein